MKNRDANKPRREQRQAEARVRQDLANTRKASEQVERLNDRLGAAFGALRERAKLAKAAPVHAEVAPKAPSAPVAPAKAPKKAKTRKKAPKVS